MYQDDPSALHVGRLTKTLDHALTRKCLKIARERGIDEFSMMHGHILGFLYCRQNQDVYQRDLEAAFNVTRSSVSGFGFRVFREFAAEALDEGTSPVRAPTAIRG